MVAEYTSLFLRSIPSGSSLTAVGLLSDQKSSTSFEAHNESQYERTPSLNFDASSVEVTDPSLHLRCPGCIHPLKPSLAARNSRERFAARGTCNSSFFDTAFQLLLIDIRAHFRPGLANSDLQNFKLAIIQPVRITHQMGRIC